MEFIDSRIDELSKKLESKFRDVNSHATLKVEMTAIKGKLEQSLSRLETARKKADLHLKELSKIRPLREQSAMTEKKTSDSPSDPSVSDSRKKNFSTEDMDPRFTVYLSETKRVVASFNRKLVKSNISPSHFFENSKYGLPKILHQDLGISRCVVMLGELISAVALEEIEENQDPKDVAEQWSIWKRRTIEMIIEYYVCVAPILFKEESDTYRYENDCIFLEHILRHIHMDKR